MDSTPFELIGVLVGIAQKNGIAIRERKSGAFFVSVIVSVFPFTTTPEASLAFPSCTAAAPAMSLTNCAPGDCIFGFSTRLIANLKVFAVTAWFDGGENLKPDLTVKV